MFIFIITIPWGIASFRLANYALWPFGRTTVPNPDAGVASLIGNILWMIFGGIWIALGLIAYGVGLCLTIIGIPWGIAAFKMVPLALTPLGQTIVRSSDVHPPTSTARVPGWLSQRAEPPPTAVHRITNAPVDHPGRSSGVRSAAPRRRTWEHPSRSQPSHATLAP